MSNLQKKPTSWLLEQIELSRADAVAGRSVDSDAALMRIDAAIARLKAGSAATSLVEKEDRLKQKA